MIKIRELVFYVFCSFCNNEFQIDGLSEGRPSVIVNDSIYLALQTDVDDAELTGVPASYFEGVVHKVNMNSVYLAPDQT